MILKHGAQGSVHGYVKSKEMMQEIVALIHFLTIHTKHAIA
jgi:hypothetical protein